MKQPLKWGVSSQCATAVSLAFEQQEESCFSPFPLLFVCQASASVFHPKLCLWLSVSKGPLVFLTRLWLEDLCIQCVITLPTLSSELLSHWLIVCPLICPFTAQSLYFVFFLSRLSSLSRSSGISSASLSAFLRASPPVLASLILIFSKCLYVIS